MTFTVFLVAYVGDIYNTADYILSLFVSTIHIEYDSDTFTSIINKLNSKSSFFDNQAKQTYTHIIDLCI